ncbi:hypothetical protein JQK62_22185, partial [Leptospira santarosai]|nr:hypothetical protein [Leptospira santarosai]
MGNTIEEVATHKAGIIKPGSPVVIGPMEIKAEQVLLEEAKNTNSRVWRINKDFSLKNGLYEDDEGHNFTNLFVPLKGPHQMNNAALAIRSVLYVAEKLEVSIDETTLSKGLSETFIPGRFEK